ncbi:MAG: tRNA preQ1(34) S-adenosylmethionine ribosyltransferase-isomerase QueA [bacterium JZ-2024 1]
MEKLEYDLPKEAIAQKPAEPRSSSRLLVLYRKTSRIEHRRFSDLPELLDPGDVLVVNNARVSPYRLKGQKIPTGGNVEILLIEKKSEREWWALVKPGRRVHRGTSFKLIPSARKRKDIPLSREILPSVQGEVIEKTSEGFFCIQFTEPLEGYLESIGHLPIPPYVKEPLENEERYQTIFASKKGALAAPTASLHFDMPLLTALKNKGIVRAEVTLLIGISGILEPEGENLRPEWAEISLETVEAIREARNSGKRIVAVGTSTVRVLESASTPERTVSPFQGWVNLFIRPGFSFRVVDALITNFHLPRSTHLALVAAFAGKDTILSAYDIALKQGYRFLSLGDAMLIF